MSSKSTTIVVSMRLTRKERDYLYYLGGGTPDKPGKSASLVLRAIIARLYEREVANPELRAPYVKAIQAATIYLDELLNAKPQEKLSDFD